MNVKAVAVLLVMLMLALPSYSQKEDAQSDQKSSNAESPKPTVGQFSFYYHSWDEGERKLCFTFLGTTFVGEKGTPLVTVCNGSDDLEWEQSFLNLLGNQAGKGLSKEAMYHQALVYASAHSKTFLTTFSENPWPTPLPKTGLLMTGWNCTKDKAITCTRTDGPPGDVSK